ncbi:nuclear transport factor 2 family protein [Egicoccus sp. AB-alg6-2]|uniref:nuclear transport factor 2 family protein n=1 Tax=Egicoccus sp. AB-alg6-2 TaxID=3242692 RepID=UPI00359D0926
MDIATWVERYRVAWERADVALASSLFVEDGTYRNDIFADPNVGQDGVAAYWERVTSHQSDVEVRMGAPFVDGNRAAVEFWTKMAVDGADVTLAGTLLLVMGEDGRCRSLRENYNLAEGRLDPPPEWGS